MWHRLVCIGYQDVLRYLTTKKQLMLKLSAEPTAKHDALLLASQCCQLTHTIWSKNRSLVRQKELVDLLVQHAELCIDLVNNAVFLHCKLFLFSSLQHVQV